MGGAGPAGTVAVSFGGGVSVGAARWGGEAGRLPAPIWGGHTAGRGFAMADPNIMGAAAQGLVPATVAQGPVTVDRGPDGEVLLRQPLAVRGPGRADQGWPAKEEARAPDSKQAEARVPAVDPVVAAVDPVVAAAGPDPEAVDRAAREAVAGMPAADKLAVQFFN